MHYTILKQQSTKAQVQAQVHTGQLSVWLNSEVHVFSTLTLLLLKPIESLDIARKVSRPPSSITFPLLLLYNKKLQHTKIMQH